MRMRVYLCVCACVRTCCVCVSLFVLSGCEENTAAARPGMLEAVCDVCALRMHAHPGLVASNPCL